MNQAAEIQRLQDRIDELEELAGMGDDDVALLKMATGLAPMACRILGIIRKRRGIASRDMIYGYVYGDRPECDQPEAKIIDVQVAHIRRKLKPLGIAIGTVWGMGYTMDDKNRAKLKTIMESYLSPPAALAAAVAGTADHLPNFLPHRAA